MNNKRRQQLAEWIKKARVLQNELESIEAEEEMSYDNMPENLQCTMNGMNSEEAIEKINEALECFEEVIDIIDDIS